MANTYTYCERTWCDCWHRWSFNADTPFIQCRVKLWNVPIVVAISAIARAMFSQPEFSLGNQLRFKSFKYIYVPVSKTTNLHVLRAYRALNLQSLRCKFTIVHSSRCVAGLRLSVGMPRSAAAAGLVCCIVLDHQRAAASYKVGSCSSVCAYRGILVGRPHGNL